MITAEEFVRMVGVEDGENNNTRMATVVDLFSNGNAKLTFDGEETPSEKEYGSLGSYLPSVGERVILLGADRTWVILGSIRFRESAGGGGVTEVNDLVVKNNINVTGTPSGGYSINTSARIRAGGRVEATAGFLHTGGGVGFFNNPTTTQKAVGNILYNADLQTAVNKINEIVNGLKSFGLFR